MSRSSIEVLSERKVFRSIFCDGKKIALHVAARDL